MALLLYPGCWRKCMKKIMTTGKNLTGIKKRLFFWSVTLGEKYDNNISGGWWYNLQLAIANKLVFSKWREALGGNISFIVTWWRRLPGEAVAYF